MHKQKLQLHNSISGALRCVIKNNHGRVIYLELSKADEIFISDGAKSDSGNIGDIFDVDNVTFASPPVPPADIITLIFSPTIFIIS